jgi:RNA polymerase sigma-70 factor, ECF subfamily
MASAASERTSGHKAEWNQQPASRKYAEHLDGKIPASANDGISGAPQADSDDALLVARAQEGDQTAFGMLVRKYQHKLIQLVARLVGEADAPDVAQESFVKAWRALKSFRGQSSFYTWLYRIGINSAKNHLVSRSRRPCSQDIDVVDAELYGHTGQLSDIDTPEAILLSSEIRHKISETINKLPPDLRQAIVLRELEGLSYEEIAQEMDCPIGTVRSRIFRARECIDSVVEPLIS